VDHWVDQAELMRMTAVIVPVYFSSVPSDDMVRHLLWMTLGDSHHYVSLENVWAVVDGDARSAALLEEIGQRLLREHGTTFNMLLMPQNRGKLWAIQRGISAALKARPDVEYLVIRDGDGDHAASDIPRLVRTAISLADDYDSLHLIVIGSRRSRHRPMGWVRGELEGLLDKITLDALAYALAREGRALNLRHCSRDAVPDLSSGYKVYGREIAEDLFIGHEPQFACLSPKDYWHYGPETVAVVEGTLKGAILAEMQRATWDGQPATSFGEFKHTALYGELLAWVYARLQIPLKVAAQLYDNYTPSMPLRTTVQGRDLLDAVRDYALKKLAAFSSDSGPTPEPRGIPPFL
jgi:hypothetical protein